MKIKRFNSFQVNENKSTKTYSIFELNSGKPSRFYSTKSKSFTSNINKATLYSKEDAEYIKNLMTKDRANLYQPTDEKNKELHIGDVYEMGLL